MHKKFYKGINPRDSEDIIFLAWDVESQGLGGKLLSICAHDGEKNHYLAGEPEEIIISFFNILFSRPYPHIWYAHNAQYDWRYILPYIIQSKFEVDLNLRTDTDIYQITINREGKKYVLRDSLAIFPGTLADFAATFTPELPKLDIEIAHFNPENPVHIQYALRDTEILREGLPRFDTTLRQDFGVGLGHTLSGTAVMAWEHSIDKNYSASTAGDRENYIRSAYYGGLTFLTRTDQVGECETYDINSSYPAVMCGKGVPAGRGTETLEYQEKLLGIYTARVRSPENLVIPILPSRDSRGHMQWRRGEFETTATNFELGFAASQGYEILEIISGIVWEETIFPFNTFVDKCKKIRQEKRGQPSELIAKRLQNGLYGKFGTRRERMEIYRPQNDEDTLGSNPIDEFGFFWSRKTYDENMRCRPEWAVFITAHARIALLETAYRVGVDNIICGDTDSLVILRGHANEIDLGQEYGQFKLEKSWRKFRAIAPKLYSGELASGQFAGAAKGLPKKKMTDSSWRLLLAGENCMIVYDSLASLRVAMSTNYPPSELKERKSSELINSKNFENCLHSQLVRPKMAI